MLVEPCLDQVEVDSMSFERAGLWQDYVICENE